MKQQNRSFAILISFVIVAIGAALAYARYRVGDNVETVAIGVGAVVLALIVSATIQVADQWDRAVILRLGKFRALKGPGLFVIIPVLDAIPYWIDTRVITTGFKAEKTLTKDTVPVDVDAVLFWKVVDPKQAALAVADYQAPSVGPAKPPCAMSSARPCFAICWKAGTKSANCSRK